MVKTLLAAAALTVLSAGLALAQDIEKGATVFKQCSPCHKIGPGATNGVGPELDGLDGRHSGGAPNYSYSDANKKSGIVWNEETFEEYITRGLLHTDCDSPLMQRQTHVAPALAFTSNTSSAAPW